MNDKLEARKFFHKYGYGIGVLVCDDIISSFSDNDILKKNHYIKVKNRLENRDLL